MKKIIISLLLSLTIILTAGCNNIETKKYSISFDANGIVENPSSIIDTQSIPEELPMLEREGYVFDGWYLDKELTKPITSDYLLENDLVLYAKWSIKYIDFTSYSSKTKSSLDAGGFLLNKVSDFKKYEGTDAYVVVRTAEELADALMAAKYKYTNVWNEDTQTVSQELEKEGTVHVIEIANDLNLGYNVISDKAKENGIINDYKTTGALSQMVKENGISQVKVENITNLLIYSKNGAKITHAGFKVTSCHNVVFRNLEMDEIWEWEDSSTAELQKIGDYDKFGWAYFKVSHCGQIWIDHMTFGKSYDGQIDYSNPVSNSKQTKIRLAYGSDGSNGLHISFCSFNAGSDNKDGYLYKMIENMENEYNNGLKNFLYYNSLRDGGLTFEQILYGLAIPQKKGFLCGDNAEAKDDFYYNAKMQISFNSCKFINFCDRIPKVRGGQCYFYNCLIDSTKYLEYRDTVKAIGAEAVKTVNSTWKCACVSQCMLVSYGGYVHFENSIIRGVVELKKNNDSGSNPFVKNIGNYSFINCTYQKTLNDEIVQGSTTDSYCPNAFVTLGGGLVMATTLWEYYDGEAPFKPDLVRIPMLEEHLNNEEYGCGTKKLVSSWLISNLV